MKHLHIRTSSILNTTNNFNGFSIVYKKLPENPVRKLVEQYSIGKFPKQTGRLKRYSCFPLRNLSSISSLQTHPFDASFRLPYIEPFTWRKVGNLKEIRLLLGVLCHWLKSSLSYVHVFTALKFNITSLSFLFLYLCFFFPTSVILQSWRDRTIAACL